MIRNAVDHALEAPETRTAAGKEAEGTIVLRARHEAGRIVVEVCDDGAGFDRERILARARERGMIAEGSRLDDDDVYRLVLAPGFSTASAVTDLSGRGVGMDVVARNVAALKGTLAIASRPGAGSTMTIRVPLTLAIIDGFAVGVAEETYVIPMDAVRECLALPRDAGATSAAAPSAGGGVLELRGAPLPFLRLRDVFALPGAPPPVESVVVVESEGVRVGLAVDALHGESEAVVKPLGEVLERADGVTGSTILGDGRVALIVDVPTILHRAMRRGERAAKGERA
jgi:two-component system chemotaxis sensor kinase CheA